MDTYTQSILPENIVALTKSTFALLQNPLRSRLNGALKIFSFFLFKIRLNFCCSNWKLQFQLESLKGFFDVDADAEKSLNAIMVWGLHLISICWCSR